ncbi:tripartite tricarboxylate transporter TctB family protein [Paracoccus saliphilus]|uniref:Tripartite tricarboxylate transporter TctB family protein n=1 Tax=Paracoccus saliphilus TaxID=405559 RepID=A0AA45W639_9RHOB|nr:tripartite tricarboxylate transporter TctB family protein [Paracoccus saliphilus]WCR01533.1 tripartite tricarboxylate transporter TctB family protein [Paracoccus saliphilus]SIS99178.1 Tripartite tricarboxylate transporter TctB family protein [Paracoccus saliphilus]
MPKLVSLRLIMAVVVIAIGLIGFVVASQYNMGSGLRMGPGYLPVVLSALLIGLGVIEATSAIVQGAPKVDIEWRAFFAILAAVTGFGISMLYLGMIPAFFICIGLCSLAEKNYGLIPALAIATLTAIGAWLLFSQLLGMTMPLFRFGA